VDLLKKENEALQKKDKIIDAALKQTEVLTPATFNPQYIYIYVYIYIYIYIYI